ncbi:hypothetical protein AQUCO_01400084v1 [Aquilegia coerulea]|uniref:tRNA-guanine(15) transglycosylase-like domain-containing protein n=1 Tax=Aquilegia coerulea TaxID=218851 RepID=A0A2G5DUG7_AQUCA|nr:hypothetical protein AQUCO_01400084v1 [Aquilegia coerulea]
MGRTDIKRHVILIVGFSSRLSISRNTVMVSRKPRVKLKTIRNSNYFLWRLRTKKKEIMKFTVKAWSGGGGGGGGGGGCGGGRARVGVLQLGLGSNGCPTTTIETPSLLVSTRKGLPLFMPLDLLSALPSPDSHLLQLSPLHFLECPSPKTISSMGGIHKMVGLKENYSFVAAPRDSMLCLPVADSTNKFGASYESPCGRRLIKPAEYMEMITALSPNIWATLADEVPAWVSAKRNRTSVDRTLRWLDECIALDRARGIFAFGAIVGGSNMEERKRCAQEVAKRNVSGYWIGGFGLGETAEERPALLNAVMDVLPEYKPRQICGLGLPEEVLEGVASGVDLFDSTYIYHLTIGGFGLIFPLNGNETCIPNSQLSDAGGDLTKINLRATIYRHNTHHYLGFFRMIREAIKVGDFDNFCQRFVGGRREHLAVAAAS